MRCYYYDYVSCRTHQMSPRTFRPMVRFDYLSQFLILGRACPSTLVSCNVDSCYQQYGNLNQFSLVA
jgi:hypothetical protein